MKVNTDIVDIPHDSLEAGTLRAVVEEFITRAATDYGAHEKSLEQKIADVMRQLQRGEARIVFDHQSDTVNIVPGARR